MYVVRIYYRPNLSRELPYSAHLMKVDGNGKDLWVSPLIFHHATLEEATRSPKYMGYRIEIME